MTYRMMLALLLAMLLGGGWNVAEAQKLKKVSASKYETRAPAKTFTFHSERPLDDWKGQVFPEGISEISYRSEDKKDYLYGILDKRGKKAAWILQPHYELMTGFGTGSLAVKKKAGGEHNYCVLNLESGICSESDFNGISNLKYRQFQTLPDWVAADILFRKTDRKHVVDVQLFTPEDRPLMIVRDVMYGLMSDAPGSGDYRIKAYQIGDELSLRTVGEDGEIRDTLLKLGDDGLVSIRHVEPHAIVEFGSLTYPKSNDARDFTPEELEKKGLEVMSMANAELGLVWPHYAGESGDAPLPEGLLGLMPLNFGYEAGQFFSRYFGDKDVALHACCDRPLGWVAVWDEAGDVAYALLPQANLPDYDAVISSRAAARYVDIERLWSPAIDTTSNKQSARRRGDLIGQYALYTKDGQVEIYSGKLFGPLSEQVMKLETTVPQSGFASWHQAATQQAASRQAASDAAWKARQEQRIAARQARDQALAEQRLRLKRKREAAEAERKAKLAEAAAARAAAEPTGYTEKVYGAVTVARMGYCNTNTKQTDLYAYASAKKACTDKGGTPGFTYLNGGGYDPFSLSIEQCYRSQAVTECRFD